MGKNYWYAVIERDEEYGNDWGYGSESLEKAKQMCLELETETAYIAVIDTDGEPMCVAEIRQPEFSDWGDQWIAPESYQF